MTAAGAPGRLRWKYELANFEQVLELAGLPDEKAWIFADDYRSAFRERTQFLEYLGPIAPQGQACERSSPALVQSALRRVNESESIFAIQMFSDLLSILPDIHDAADQMKINWPGTFGAQNWSARMPLALETLIKKPFNTVLKAMHQTTGRV